MHATLPPNSPGEPRKHDAKSPPAVAALKEAEEACKWAADLAAGRHRIKKAVTCCWARLQRYASPKEPNLGTEPESGALGLLELLSSNLLDGGAARAGALSRAKELLIKDGVPRPEPELWVKVAQQALAMGGLTDVVQVRSSRGEERGRGAFVWGRWGGRQGMGR